MSGARTFAVPSYDRNAVPQVGIGRPDGTLLLLLSHGRVGGTVLLKKHVYSNTLLCSRTALYIERGVLRPAAISVILIIILSSCAYTHTRGAYHNIQRKRTVSVRSYHYFGIHFARGNTKYCLSADNK